MITDAKIDGQLKSAGVKFLPFVGDSYEYGISFDEEGNLVLGTKEKPGKKVLVLGECHYCDEEISEEDMNSFTRDVVNRYLKSSSNGDKSHWKSAFFKFERAFYNHVAEPSETKNFWEHVMFYAYLQRGFVFSRENAILGDYKKAETPFWKTLETFNPDVVVVLGKRLYDWLPDGNGEPITFNFDEEIDAWKYHVNNQNVLLLCINHPSGAFDCEYWNYVLASSLKEII